MDAIMTTLAAVLLANADGRTGAMLARLIAARGDRRGAILAFFIAFLGLAAVSAVGALVASRTLGPGVLNLFAAIALGSAATALLWTRRGGDDTQVEALAALSLPWLFVRLVLIQLGDRNQFLIFALGALSGAALWGAAGGALGLLIAVLPLLALGPTLRVRTGANIVRWIAAALLILWAAMFLRAAFGV